MKLKITRQIEDIVDLTIKVGTVLRHGDGDLYMICLIEYKGSYIVFVVAVGGEANNLGLGYCRPFPVENMYDISLEELRRGGLVFKFLSVEVNGVWRTLQEVKGLLA